VNPLAVRRNNLNQYINAETLSAIIQPAVEAPTAASPPLRGSPPAPCYHPGIPFSVTGIPQDGFICLGQFHRSPAVSSA
jgi:hypothetical protein